jgi:hypothetical protein
MSCSKYLIYSENDGNWYATHCGGTDASGPIVGGTAVYTDCIIDGTLATSRGTIILEITDCVDTTPTPTPVVCGQGITDVGYYYTDCCGNFVRGNTPGQIVSLNYGLPYNGIKILNVPTSEICATPTQTPTTSQTPTPTPNSTPTLTPSITQSATPTLTPTPSQTPAVVYYNECEPITIFPMEIECITVQNPTTSTSFDGILYVNVTGGTPPYNFYWNTGERSQTISNAPVGNYTVLVIDYYGDFSATTTCSLIGPTSTATPTPTLTMTPTPSLSLTSLCLLFTPLGSYGSSGQQAGLQLTFVPSGNANGKPTWYNSSQNLTITWSITNNRWEITNWSYGGIPVNTNPSLIPSSGWVILGTPTTYGTIISTVGNCPTVTPLTYTLQVVPSSCNTGTCTGSIFVNTQGGVPPYSYSIDSQNYQSSNIFLNLCPTTYGLIVKDSLGTILTQSVTITYNSTFTTYTLSLVVDGVTNLNQNTRRIDWHVEVVPPLPAGPSIEFTYLVNSVQQKQGPFNASPNTTMTITSSNNIEKNQVPIVLAVNSTSVQTLPNVCSPSTLTMEQTSISQSKNVTISTNDTFSGNSLSFIDVFNPTTQDNCVSTGVQDIGISLQNVTLKGGVCANVEYIQEPITLTHRVVGVLTSLACLAYTCTPSTPYGLSIEWEDCNGNYTTQTFFGATTVCAREGTLNITNGTGIIQNIGSCS